MGGLLKRWIKLHERLLGLKHGPAAVLLPPEVTRIHLHTAKAGGTFHLGARKFWKQFLPQLKYHNPRIPMILNRHGEPKGDGLLSIYMLKEPVAQDGDAPASRPKYAMTSSWYNMAKAPEPLPDERVVRIETKFKTQEEILEKFLYEAKAQKVEPTEEEQALITKFESEKKKLEHTQSESFRLARESEEAGAISAKAKAMALGASA